MDVGVFRFVIPGDRIDHPPRFLRGGAVIQINQRMAMRLGLQNGELAAEGAGVLGEKDLFTTETRRGTEKRENASKSRWRNGRRLDLSLFSVNLRASVVNPLFLQRKCPKIRHQIRRWRGGNIDVVSRG
jgi:hypothetical protein